MHFLGRALLIMGQINNFIQRTKKIIKRLIQKYRKNFLQEILAENLSCISRLIVIMTLIEIFLIFFLYFVSDLSILPNLSFVIVNLFFYKLIQKTQKKTINIKFLQGIAYLYLIITLVFGLTLTFMRFKETESAYIYIMFIFGIASIFTFTPLNSLIFFSGSCFIFCVCASYFLQQKTALFILSMNMIAMHFVAWIMTIILVQLKYTNFLDRQELVGKNEELKTMSVTDAMTGLYNHEFLYNCLIDNIKTAKRQNIALTIAMLDIDDFKKINDTFGHPVGDQVLKQFAEIIKFGVRGNDVVGRYGGEEFIILFKQTTVEDAKVAIKRIKTKAENTKWACGVKVTFSCGISGFAGESAEALINSADKKLYYVKNNGKNNFISEIPSLKTL